VKDPLETALCHLRDRRDQIDRAIKTIEWIRESVARDQLDAAVDDTLERFPITMSRLANQ
jgi:hypothetical protein